MCVDGGKGREHLHETQGFAVGILGEKDHRLIAGDAFGDEVARLWQVRRLAVEAAIGVEQWGDFFDVRGVCAQGQDRHEGAPLRSRGSTA
ncbi:hypothetical protein D3C84_1006030 [compost metagenome]